MLLAPARLQFRALLAAAKLVQVFIGEKLWDPHRRHAHRRLPPVQRQFFGVQGLRSSADHPADDTDGLRS